jgi:protein-disulfide isomerase
MSKRTVRQTVINRRRGRQNQWLIIGGIVIAAMAVVVILVVVGNTSNGASPVDVGRYVDLTQEVDRTGAPAISLGSKSATATLVEYSDFSCPHCRAMADTIHQLVATYVRPGRLRIIYKPVSFINPTYSPSAARALLCAGKQSKGWEMHDRIWALFDSNTPGAYSLDSFRGLANGLALDTAEFSDCFNSVESTTALTQLEEERIRLGINSTPTMMLNGQVISGNIEAEVAAAIGN